MSWCADNRPHRNLKMHSHNVFDNNQEDTDVDRCAKPTYHLGKNMLGVEMSQRTWRDTKGHQWFDKRARDEIPLIEVAHGGFTTPMKGWQHVAAHRDTRQFGRIGAVARYDINRSVDGEGFLTFLFDSSSYGFL